MSYRLIVYKKDEEPNIHHFDNYDLMDYSATLLQFSSNPNLVQVVAQEEKLIGWETLFRINYNKK